MTMIDFEDAIAELLQQIYSAGPKDDGFSTIQLRSAFDSQKRSSLRLVPVLNEAESFGKADI